MSDLEAKDTQPPAWACVLLLAFVHLLMTGVVLAISIDDALAYRKSSPAVEAAGWVLVFPLAAAAKCGLELPPSGFLLLLPNSLLYGLMWYSGWRMLGWMLRAGSKQDG